MPRMAKLSTGPQIRIVLVTRDYSAARRFYERELGLEVLEEWDDEDADGCLLRLAGDTSIELLGRKGAHAHMDEPPMRVAVQVPSATDAHAVVAGVGSAVDAPSVKPWGHASFDATDPEGNALTFWEQLGQHA